MEAKKILDDSLSLSSKVTLMISKTTQAVSELKEVNTLLTEIIKENNRLSKSKLSTIVSNSFDVAGRYGKKAADYLSGVQTAYSLGYEDAEGIAWLGKLQQASGHHKRNYKRSRIYHRLAQQ